jgi:GNAT superfamily N-acetyltransferase
LRASGLKASKTRTVAHKMYFTGEYITTCFRLLCNNHVSALEYSYELQVAASHRRCGIGLRLMANLEKIAQRVNMDLIMLTVLKGMASVFYPPLSSNVSARSVNRVAFAFYRDIGFVDAYPKYLSHQFQL